MLFSTASNSSICPAGPWQEAATLFLWPNFDWPTSSSRSRVIYFFLFLACTKLHSSKRTYAAMEIILEVAQALLLFCTPADAHRENKKELWERRGRRGEGSRSVRHSSSYTVHTLRDKTKCFASPGLQICTKIALERNKASLALLVFFQLNSHSHKWGHIHWHWPCTFSGTVKPSPPVTLSGQSCRMETKHTETGGLVYQTWDDSHPPYMNQTTA